MVPFAVLVVLDQPLLVQLVMLRLNHGVYDTRAAASGTEAVTTLPTWQPHLVLLDMGLDGSMTFIAQIGSRGTAAMRLPVIAFTRRGDLKTKLAAFEVGVDDILTVPFAPEELLARVIALVRRSYSDAVTSRQSSGRVSWRFTS